MKKKIFLAVIAIFVICLTCGMLFVACNDKEDNNESDPGKTPGGGGGPVIGSNNNKVFEAVLDEIGELKANPSQEYNFALEITAKDVSVFTLAFEQYEDKDYIYAAVGNEFVKINGFDLGGVLGLVLCDWLIDDVTGNIAGVLPADPAEFKEFLIPALDLIGLSLFTDESEIAGDAYYMDIDLASLASYAGSFLGGEDDATDGDAEEAEGILATIDSLLPKVFGALGLDLGEGVTPSLSTLLDYLGKNIGVKVYFGFGECAADTSTEPFGKFDISKKIADARAKDPINVLNLSTQLEFEALTIDEENETVNKKYVLDIDLDLDPFVLVREYDKCEFGLLSMIDKDGVVGQDGFKLFIDDEKFSMDAIMEMVADAGYLHISLDEVAIEASEGVAVGGVVKNLFTLHFDSEEGKAVASAAIVNQVNNADYAIGGVYDIKALTSIINSLIPAGPAAEECKHVDADNNCICDNCGAVTDWMGLVGYLFNNIGQFITVEKDGETVTGATVKFQNIADFLIDNVVKHAITAEQLEVVEAQLPALMASVIGGNALKIDLTGISFAYGKLTEDDRVATEKLVYNLREDASWTGTNDDMYMETVTGVTAKDGGEIAAGSLVTVTGTAFDDGETAITTDGIIMAVDGDTYYVGILTDFYANYEGAEAIVNGFIGTAGTHVDLDKLIKPNWPFYGVLTYTVSAEV